MPQAEKALYARLQVEDYKEAQQIEAGDRSQNKFCSE
jgi:hypothetical protein